MLRPPFPFLVPPEALPVVPTALPPLPPPVPLFSSDRGGLVVGVEEIQLVEEIALVDWFIDCVFILLRLLCSRSKVLPWRRTLTSMYLVF